ncbi:hypothetical protein [Treponema sp. OMZ 857]|uniref:hypothetical protein n=1 Tax=Treponema sp. OMZ 857 TaxID=1643513 RepID=UPI0020A60479|nr:hypothetical protein [Treponema sp. OMZ 857]UTC43934.1 hypothetical protein E4N66_07540 [Treponema sp. OMZ 857]
MKKDIFAIPKNYLVLIAGILWIFAGIMVFKTGAPILFGMQSLIAFIVSIGIFLIFYLIIFRKLVFKHIKRIKETMDERGYFWQFFDLKSYIIMFVMMTGGTFVRKLNLAPNYVIGILYSGIGFALFSCGTRFIAAFVKKYVL